AGTVLEVGAREGDRVAAGDVLVRLDDRETRAAVLEAEAALAEVRATVTRAIAEAERESAQAQRDLERIQAVRRTGGLTQQMEEEAEIRAADAASRLDELRSGMDGASEPPAVVTAQATLERARARLELTRVRAPGTGTVLSRGVEPGDAVAPGQALLEMAFEGPTELVAFPAEENLGQLGLEAPATVSADAFPDRIFEASVSLIAPAVDPTQGTIEVRLAVLDPPEYLRPDMTVSINIETGRTSNASILPASAVRGLGGGEPWVAVVKEGRVEMRPVEVGLVTGAHVEVRSGLAAEDFVVAEAADVEVGQKVRMNSVTPRP
ncbi:MAG: efflux RND transporter periplasmic adaptor subunit, partial [Gemmatimonadetes bacterium]|nr:efflux RND transporter periplasmic adaptor subunit [Gemmatimonadota bacterium]